MKTMRKLTLVRETKHTHMPQFQEGCNNDRESNAVGMNFRNKTASFFSHSLKQLNLSLALRKSPNNKTSKHTVNELFVIQTERMYHMKSELRILFSNAKIDGTVVEVQS